MGTKELIGAGLTMVGGYFLGYANGIETTIGSIFATLSDTVAEVFNFQSYGIEAGIGQEIGQGIEIKLGRYIMNEMGNNIGGFKILGIVLILAGLIYSYRTKTNNTKPTDEK